MPHLVGARPVPEGGASSQALVGPWLVVVTTSALLPFEVYEIAHRVSFVRVFALVMNVAIVVYLARGVRREAIS